MPQKSRKHSFRDYALLIILTLIMIIQLYPLIFLLFFSMKDNSEIFSGNVLGPPKHWAFENYISALTNGNVAIYLTNSIIVTATVLILTILLASMAAFAIARMKWRLSHVTLILFLLGMMISRHAALLPLFLMMRSFGILNSRLSLIIPYTGFALPLAIFVFTGFFRTIPVEIEEAAQVDGCSPYRIFFQVVFPLVKPAAITIAIFTYLHTWNELLFALTFISREMLKTLPVGIISMVGQYITEWGPVGAGLVIATLPTILFYLRLSSYIERGLTTGSVKG